MITARREGIQEYFSYLFGGQRGECKHMRRTARNAGNALANDSHVEHLEPHETDEERDQSHDDDPHTATRLQKPDQHIFPINQTLKNAVHSRPTQIPTRHSRQRLSSKDTVQDAVSQHAHKVEAYG